MKKTGIFGKLFGGRRDKNLGRDPEKLYRHAVELFGKERFEEAAEILEEAAELSPNSSAVHFTLGVTYSKIAGKFKNEDAMRPWAKKSLEALRKSINLANQYGGLNDEQLTIARNAVTGYDRVFEREQPTIAEDQRRRIYAEFVEKKDAKLLYGTSLVQDFAAATGRPKGLADMMQSLKDNAAKAEETAVEEITKKYGISRGQLIDIAQEGKEKNWPFRAVFR